MALTLDKGNHDASQMDLISDDMRFADVGNDLSRCRPAMSAQQPATSLNVVIGPNPPADECDHLSGQNPINFFDAYSWQTFIALNWPAASGSRGVPDTAKNHCDRTAPRVWETWKSVEEAFVPGGIAPAAWNDPKRRSFAKTPANYRPHQRSCWRTSIKAIPTVGLLAH